MEERQVTVAGTTHVLPPLFLVMATQNPIEQEGTYPLPEAQMVRFLMHVLIGYPDAESEREIVRLVRSEDEAVRRSGDPALAREAEALDRALYAERATAEWSGRRLYDLALRARRTRMTPRPLGEKTLPPLNPIEEPHSDSAQAHQERMTS